MKKRQKHHYHHHANSVKKVTDRTKHGPTRTQKSHLYNRGPYHDPGRTMGRYKSPFKKSIRYRLKRFLSRFFHKVQIVHVKKNPAIKIARANMKPIASMKVVTRVHQRKGERWLS